MGLGKPNVIHGSAGRPVPGFVIKVLDRETGKQVKHGEIGDICAKLPLPPGWCVAIMQQQPTLVSQNPNRSIEIRGDR